MGFVESVIIFLFEKFGLKAFAVIVADYGVLAAFLAWVHFVPFTPLIAGLVLIGLGAFLPRLPDPNTKHSFKMGTGKVSLEVSGTMRTMLVTVGAALVIYAVVQGGVGASGACASGELYDPDAKRCTKAPPPPTSATCPPDAVYQSTSHSCEKPTPSPNTLACPLGTVYRASTQTCENIMPALKNKFCSPGTIYNYTTQTCDDFNFNIPKSTDLSATCGILQTYNTMLKKCVATCLLGYFDIITEKCVIPHICPDSMKYNSVTNTCELDLYRTPG